MFPPIQKPRMGRPLSRAAKSHSAIMDAVYDMLQQKSARDLTMEAIAKRAGVGKPTLYRWWPTKAALLMAMFHERLAHEHKSSTVTTVEAAFSRKMQRVVADLSGLFGKVMADLIAESQSNPKLLRELHNHICYRRSQSVLAIQQGIQSGEFLPGTDPELVVDMLFGPAYYRLLLGFPPLSKAYADALVTQVLQGIKSLKTETTDEHVRQSARMPEAGISTDEGTAEIPRRPVRQHLQAP